jgi:hypothetical protein
MPRGDLHHPDYQSRRVSSHVVIVKGSGGSKALSEAEGTAYRLPPGGGEEGVGGRRSALGPSQPFAAEMIAYGLAGQEPCVLPNLLEKSLL